MGVDDMEWSRASKACAGRELSQIVCAMACQVAPHAISHVCSGVARKKPGSRTALH